MKKIIFVFALMMAATTYVEGHNFYNKHVTISFQTFYDDLSPYGEWINTPEYGYAWRPYLDNAEDFRPYSSKGNWVYTDLGWTWVSEYRWGWATFHYGRWTFDDYLGWMWIPGNEWAPAWVTWGSYDDCWAWAPMGPNIQININDNWHAPRFWWTFVPYRHFCSNDWYAYRYNQPVQITNITYVTNVYYGNNDRHNNGNWYYGPRVRDVEKHLNARVRKMQVVDADKPDNLNARNNRVAVYRPSVSKERDNVQPSKYRELGNARTEQKNQRTTANAASAKESPVKTREVNRNSKERSTPEVSSRSQRQYTATESNGSNNAVNNSAGRNVKESNSRSVKINRSEPARENVINRNTGQSTRATNPVGKKASLKPSRESSSSRSSSPSKTRNQ